MGFPAASDGSISIVTGASAGLGVEIAKQLAKRGHSLALVARRKERLDEIAASLRDAHGVRVEPIACDVSDASSRDAMLARIAELELDVDVLVNNAGYGSSGLFQDLPAATETEMVSVNVEAVVALCAATVPAMAKRKRGAVMNVASTIAFQPMPGSATYAATKAFVLNFTEALHTELAPSGVYVTAFCPGVMPTEFLEGHGVEQGAARLPKKLAQPGRRRQGRRAGPGARRPRRRAGARQSRRCADRAPHAALDDAARPRPDREQRRTLRIRQPAG